MAYHARNGVSVNVTPMGVRSKVRVRAPGMDTFHFYSSSVPDAHKRLTVEADALEAEGYTGSAAALRRIAEDAFPTA